MEKVICSECGQEFKALIKKEKYVCRSCLEYKIEIPSFFDSNDEWRA